MFKQEIKALPEGITDHLPVKSSAIPMPDDVVAFNQTLPQDLGKGKLMLGGR